MSTKKTITADELDAKLAADGITKIGGHPPVGDVWASQIASGVDEDDEDDVIADNAAVAVLDTAAPPENADAFDEGRPEPTYVRTEHDSERQTVETFDPLTVVCQLQDSGFNAKSNGLTYWLRFGTGEEVSNRVAKVKGADLVFNKVLIGRGVNVTLVSSSTDVDGNVVTKIKVILPESEMMRADVRPLLGKKGVLTLEPAQMEFDLTARAE